MCGIFHTSNLRVAKLTIVGLALVGLAMLIVAGLSNAGDASNSRATREREWLKGEGAFFVSKTCTSCHSISAFGIEAGKTGPDLSEAVVDVERRFGKTLEEFLHSPSGTMSIVLATKIPLTNAEKQEAIRLLKIAYQRKLENSHPGR